MRAYLKIVSLRFLQTSGAHRAKAGRAQSGDSFADLSTSGTAPASAATLGNPHGMHGGSGRQDGDASNSIGSVACARLHSRFSVARACDVAEHIFAFFVVV